MTTTDTRPQPGTWTIDPAHTTIGFRARHLMAAKVRGGFTAFTGKIRVGESVQDSSAEVTIESASIDTGVADRDAHLRSPDFLDSGSHPTIEFVSTDISPVADGRYRVDGELSIRGKSRPVTLDVEYRGLVTDPWGNTKALFSASTRIDRERWGLTWNQALESGGWLVGKEVEIELEVQAIAT